MSWGMVAGAAITVVGGIISDKNKSKSENKAYSKQTALENQQSLNRREEKAYEASVDYAYKQKERAGRQRGLDEFRKFSTVGQFAPTYVDTSQRIQDTDVPLPTQPGYSTQEQQDTDQTKSTTTPGQTVVNMPSKPPLPAGGP